jgi:thioredoxin 1
MSSRTSFFLIIAAVFVGIIILSKPHKNSGESSETLDQNLKLPRLLELGSSSCIPCQKMKPIILELKKEFEGKMIVDLIDVGDNPQIGQKYSINLIPTQIFFDRDGKELFRHEGFYAKEKILEKWEELGLKFSAEKNSD